MREKWQKSRSRCVENHLTYAEALQLSGYFRNSGIVVLSTRLGATWQQRTVNAAADALIDMSQTSG